MINIIEVTEDLREAYNYPLLEFAKTFKYPFGHDQFTIDHGSNYFAFFDRLGTPYILIAKEDNKIIGVVIAILRNITNNNISISKPIWYICDLKIHPAYQGRFIVSKFLDIALHKYSHISTQVYGISMNSSGLGLNRLIKFAQRFTELGLMQQETLIFYLIVKDQMNILRKIMQKYFNSYSFTSLAGIKDLVLTSTNQALPFAHFSRHKRGLHLQYDSSGDLSYMLCFPSLHPIVQDFNLIGLKAFTTASIISNIKNWDWSFIESHEI